VAKLRHEHPVFRRRRYFVGQPVRGHGGVDDIAWFTPGGMPMSDEDWESGFAKSVGVFLNGEGIPDRDARGERVVDESFLLLFNAHFECMPFTLPGEAFGQSWQVLLDTAAPLVRGERGLKAGSGIDVEARSLLVLRRSY